MVIQCLESQSKREKLELPVATAMLMSTFSYRRMNSPPHEELTSGMSRSAKAQAFVIKSFTEIL
jgi:hypothetical protein